MIFVVDSLRFFVTREFSRGVFIHKSTPRIAAFNLHQHQILANIRHVLRSVVLANCTCTSIILAALDWRTCICNLFASNDINRIQSIDRVWFCSAQHHTTPHSSRTRFHIYSHYAPFSVNAHRVSSLLFYFIPHNHVRSTVD